MASRYSIIAAREIHEASQALADVPGNLSRGGEALRRSQERRRAREEAPGPTAFGSRPDEQPRFGVRLPQPGSSTPDRTSATPAGTTSDAPAVSNVSEDYDPFLRSPRPVDRKDQGASASSQETGDEAGSGDEN